MARRTSSCPTTGSLGRLRAASCRPTPFARCATGCLSGEKSEPNRSGRGARSQNTARRTPQASRGAERDFLWHCARDRGRRGGDAGRGARRCACGRPCPCARLRPRRGASLAHTPLAQVVAAGPGRMTSAGEVVPVGISAGARKPTTDSRARRWRHSPSLKRPPSHVRRWRRPSTRDAPNLLPQASTCCLASTRAPTSRYPAASSRWSTLRTASLSGSFPC